jgi:adenosine deaminase
VKNTDRTWHERLPKVELHIHLEGAIPPATLFALIRKYGGHGDLPDVDALRERFVYRDFTHFLETWTWKNGFLREYEDFSIAAESVARSLSAQNVLYAEAFFSPSDFSHHGLTTGGIAESIRSGLRRVPGVEVGLIADLVRDRGPVEARRTLDEVREARGFGIVGIGIGGSEERYPPGPFAGVFEEARKQGFRTSAHAGEAAGAASVRSALQELRADRIGHAVRAAEDDALLDLLAEKRTPLELCPLSNVRCGIVRSIREHPARLFFDRGLVVTVNTDDPAMFGTSLADEYGALERELGFSRDDIRRVVRNAAAAAWLPAERKKALESRLISDPAWGEDASPGERVSPLSS